MTDPDSTLPPQPLPSIDGYVDLELIGGGGSADVYRATDPSFERQVAIKVLRVHLDAGTAQDEFRRECLAIGRVGDHPNIIRVYSAGGTRDGRPYLAMALMEGSYAHDLPADGLPIDEVLRTGTALCGAVATAHAAGVLHRDIKPENLLRSRFGTCVLADFGVSTVVARTTTRSPLGLTLQHAAPEVLEGNAATERSDVYSLASTLYQLATGSAPFAGDGDPFAPMQKLNRPGAPALAAVGAPAELDAALHKALLKDPGKRTSSAAELGRQLEECAIQAGVPVSPMELSEPPRPLAGSPDDPASGRAARDTTKWMRLSRARLSAAAVVLAVALIGGGVWLVGSEPGGSSDDSGAEVLGQSTGTGPPDWGDTPEELLQSLDRLLADHGGTLIEGSRGCITSEFSSLNEPSLRSLLDSGAGDPRNVERLAAALESCQVSPGTAALDMVGGELDPGTVDVPAGVRSCVTERIERETALSNLAVLLLTPPSLDIVRSRVMTDALAQATAACLPQNELAARLRSAVQAQPQPTDSDAPSPQTDLLMDCISQLAQNGTLGEQEGVSKQPIWPFLVDDSSFPAPLRAAYASVRATATASFLAPTGAAAVSLAEDGSSAAGPEMGCAWTLDDACFAAESAAAEEPYAAVVC